jgi:hypothetical protein
MIGKIQEKKKLKIAFVINNNIFKLPFINFFMSLKERKRGLSTIVATLIIILLVLVATGII